MTAPVSSSYRGWYWDEQNQKLDVYFGLGAAGDPLRIHQMGKYVETFQVSVPAANMADGYGCWEVDTYMTGTATGHFAASSSWVNLVSGTAESTGGYVTPHNDGIYEDSAYTITGAFLVIGQRMQAVLGETGYTALTLWSVNSNRTITALFDYNSAGALGITTATPTAAASRSVAFCRDSNGNILYMRLYDDATT